MTEEENITMEQELEKPKQAQASLPEELGDNNNRVTELEQTLNIRDTEVNTLKQKIEEMQNQLNAVNGTLNQAITSYRVMKVKANPDMPAELITGDTIEAIDKAADSARELVGKVREKLMTAQAQTRVPAGAPPRIPPDLSALSPREKIRQGIGKQS
ncbi:MAG: hypothetical protein JW967_08465 [Dehalococcoidales bacterium]|nr:hypothetical protein [Dehalococcoidales bacterium]